MAIISDLRMTDVIPDATLIQSDRCFDKHGNPMTKLVIQFKTAEAAQEFFETIPDQWKDALTIENWSSTNYHINFYAKEGTLSFNSPIWSILKDVAPFIKCRVQHGCSLFQDRMVDLGQPPLLLN